MALLKNFGVRRGDRVALYLPMIPELPVFMLAATRLGAMHTVVFSGFDSDALAKRLNDLKAKLPVTADSASSGGQVVRLKELADEALKQALSVENVIVVKHAGVDVRMRGGQRLLVSRGNGGRGEKRLC